jgi:WD40 repeat protein
MISVENASSVEEIWRWEGHTGPVFAVAFDHDSTLVASGSVDTTVRVWDMISGDEKYVLDEQEDVIAAVAFNYDEDNDAIHLLSAAYGHHLLEYDMADGSFVRENGGLDADPSVVIWIDSQSVAFSPDGLKFADSLGLEVWDVENQEMYASDNFDSYYERAWSGDGTLLAGMTDSNVINYFMFDPDTEMSLQTGAITGIDTDSYYSGFAVNDDGTAVAITDDATSDIQIYYLGGDAGPRLAGHTPNNTGSLGVYGLSFSQDGTLLASASYDNTLRIWDVESGEALAVIETDGDGLATVAFSPDGRYIVTGDLNGAVQVWGLPMP